MTKKKDSKIHPHRHGNSGQGYSKQEATRPRLRSSATVSAIIPAYNEAKTIGEVLAVLSHVNFLSEIIVIDDGSTDGTAEVVKALGSSNPKIRLLRHSENLGKGQAVFNGWCFARSPYLLTLDADLIGLTPLHVNDLCLPVLQSRADMTLGLFCQGYWRTDTSHRLTPWLTGQRCFRSGLLKFVSGPAASGYGIETALTIAARQRSWRILRVPWVGVSHPPSEVHRGPVMGLLNRARMYAQIIRAWAIAEGFQGVIARLKEWSSTF